MATVSVTEMMMESTISIIMEGSEKSSSSSSSSSNMNHRDGVLFFGVSLVMGIGCRHALHGTRVPYTVALLILGIALGSLEYGTHHGLGKFGNGIRLWATMDPDLLLAVFLPALLFESSFSLELHQIKRCIGQMILLAGPGVLISTFCLGCALKLTFPYNWSWTASLLLGGLLSATDPVAVFAMLKELGTSKKMSTMIEGESFMNDGVAIVVYQLFYHMILGEKFSWGFVFKFLALNSLGAVGIGFAFGILSVWWLGFIFNDTVIEITLTFAVSYIAYFTAQEVAEVSGVLAVITLGMFYAAVARTAFKSDGQRSLHHFWEMVAYIANTLIFISSGVVIAEGTLGSGNTFHRGSTWAYLLLLYIFVLATRFIVVGVLYPFLQCFGYGLDWKEATILIWSGLRGAVALALSLSVKRMSNISTLISSETGNLFVFFTGGIVFLTLVLNGSTTQFILNLLDMNKLSVAKMRILDHTKYEMYDRSLKAFCNLGDDEELGPVDWPTVKGHIASLKDLEEESESCHVTYNVHTDVKSTNLEDIRIRLLNRVRAAYWVMLDDGRITQKTANILMQSVDEAIDLASHGPLCDWKDLQAHVDFPNYYKFLKVNIFPQKLVTHYTIWRLESACCLCAAFLRAHKIARQQLHEFLGDSVIASVIFTESKEEGEEAKKFLEDVRLTFPQVLRVVKTRQTAYSVLHHLLDYIQTLEKIGILDQKEMLPLHDAVQTDLKRLQRNPPLVKIPTVTDLIRVHPMLGALPSTVRELLEGSRLIMVPRGLPLYSEGSRASGVWLICNGVVKWTSKAMRSGNSLHPTFTHGSTLGLYEVLVGNHYISDIIADSLLVCLFIERDKMLLAMGSASATQDFLWQESVIYLAKVLLPQVFEKMSMQDLRALVAERSLMTIYVRGDTVDIPCDSVGLLLQGVIRPHNFQKVISSPAVLLPMHRNPSFLSVNRNQSSLPTETSDTSVSSLSHQGSCYKVEETARIMILQVSPFQTASDLWGSESVYQPHRPWSRRDHGGLSSWPETSYRSSQPVQNIEGTNRLANSLSSKAMHLSIFGSTVGMRWRRSRSL